MIQKEQIGQYFRVRSDDDLGKFGPFQSLRFGGNFLGKKFEFDTSALKSWKHCVGLYNGSFYLLEETNNKLKNLN